MLIHKVAKAGFLTWLLVGLGLMYHGVSYRPSAAAAPATPGHEQLLIDDDFTYRDLRQHVHLSYAPDHLRFSSVSAYIDDWLPVVPLAPLPENSRLWFKFKLNHLGTSPQDLTLYINNTALDYVDVYILDDKARIIQSYTKGAKRPTSLSLLNNRGYEFPFEVKPEQPLTVIVGIIDDGILAFPIELWQRQALQQQHTKNLITNSLVLGGFVIFCLFFMLSYIMRRRPFRFWFALACLCVSFSYLSFLGVKLPWQALQLYRESITLGLCLVTLFTLIKMTQGLLPKINLFWRYFSYLPLLIGVGSIAFNSTYYMLITGLIVFTVTIISQVCITLVFYDKERVRLSLFLLCGWILSGYAMGMQIIHYLQSTPANSPLTYVNDSLFVMACILFGFAIGSREHLQLTLRMTNQQKRIDDLQVFYRLFRNSAEGLYTSTLDGTLLSINPAMCKLFGFDNEEQMLNEVSNTQEFYAHQEDRDLLIGELLNKGVVLGRELKGRRRDQSDFWFSLSSQLHRDGDSSFMYGSIFDITERKQSSISLEYLATHDPLTGLLNRRQFEQDLQRTIHDHASFALLYIDIDRFKVINDSCGHGAGDLLIKEIGQLLQGEIKHKGQLARLGGDEFALLLTGYSNDEAYIIANRLLNLVQQYRFTWENRIFTISISIGLLTSDIHQDQAEQIIGMADAACYIAKENGRNRIHSYSTKDQSLQRYQQELDCISELNQAFEKNSFVLYFQTYVPLNKANDGDYYEILVRLSTDNGNKILSPANFLPAAERYNLSVRLDRWVIENTFQWLAQHPHHCQSLQRCNINLSGHSLADNNLKLLILNAFEKYQIPYHKICFEITETNAIVKLDETLSFISTFKELGCLFALDDFGSGFSSYEYLKTLPVDVVKIGGTFIRNILTDKVDLAMVASIRDIAKAMGMETLAEFVDNRDIIAELGKINIDYAQGFAIAKPTPLSEFPN
jgi:diguanylate cyclase (GGDEF)-like protein/PAS domain S-box-containing protein